MEKLRKKERQLGLRRYSVMKQAELEAAIEEAEQDAYYKQVTCQVCLREQRKQTQIDEYMYNKKTLANVVRDLCKYCDRCEIVHDGDERICGKCEYILNFIVSYEGNYLSHRVKHR